MKELGRDQLLKERVLGSGGHGDIAAVGKRNHAQRILQTHLGGNVAGNDRDRADVEFGRVEREHQGQGVVGAGVGVENDLLGSAGGTDQYCGEQRGDD